MSEGVAIILQLALVTGQRVGMISGMAKAGRGVGSVAPAWPSCAAREPRTERLCAYR